MEDSGQRGLSEETQAVQEVIHHIPMRVNNTVCLAQGGFRDRLTF